MKAWLNLRHVQSLRADIFRAGLRKLGYQVTDGLTIDPREGDLLITWNRIGPGNAAANIFLSRGLPVVVSENSSWGNNFQGKDWLFMNRTLHNTSGLSPVGGDERWDSLGVELAPWRETGQETVILAQRGIGSPPVAMPRSWPSEAQRKWGGRIRSHPGNRPHPVPLADDLNKASRVVTWSSGSAITALMMGIPVFSEAPKWVGQQDNTDDGRLSMFRRLAWNQWQLSEIESGEAFAWMLQ